MMGSFHLPPRTYSESRTAARFLLQVALSWCQQVCMVRFSEDIFLKLTGLCARVAILLYTAILWDTGIF